MLPAHGAEYSHAQHALQTPNLQATPQAARERHKVAVCVPICAKVQQKSQLHEVGCINLSRDSSYVDLTASRDFKSLRSLRYEFTEDVRRSPHISGRRLVSLLPQSAVEALPSPGTMTMRSSMIFLAAASSTSGTRPILRQGYAKTSSTAIRENRRRTPAVLLEALLRRLTWFAPKDCGVDCAYYRRGVWAHWSLAKPRRYHRFDLP